MVSKELSATIHVMESRTAKVVRGYSELCNMWMSFWGTPAPVHVHACYMYVTCTLHACTLHACYTYVSCLYMYIACTLLLSVWVDCNVSHSIHHAPKPLPPNSSAFFWRRSSVCVGLNPSGGSHMKILQRKRHKEDATTHKTLTNSHPCWREEPGKGSEKWITWS